MNGILAKNRKLGIGFGAVALAFFLTGCDRSSSLKTGIANYDSVVQKWNTPEDASEWIGANFRYDDDRAALLSQNKRENGPVPEIYDAPTLFDRKSGVCVDLSRFCVETLKNVCPESDPKFLKIEFEPVEIGGNMFRFHWVTSFKRDGKTFVMADSKRPGKIVGPYRDIDGFSADYQRFRNRKIIGVQELDSYQKTLKQKMKRRIATSKKK